jgi:hypothetical protein
MAAFRKPVTLRGRVRWTYFKQNTELHVFLALVVADTLYRMVSGGISEAISAFFGLGIFCFLFAPVASMIADLFFEAMEKLTRNGSSKKPPHSKHDGPSKDDPRPDSKPRTHGKHNSKGKGKFKGNPASQGKAPSFKIRPSTANSPAKGSCPSKSDDTVAPASPSGGRVSKSYLARFVPEIRLQIFQHYFAMFRPESCYRESHYRNIESANLLNALNDGLPNEKLYQEALGQYRKSHQFGLLLSGEGIGKGYLDKLEAGVFQSLKDITFGPG